MNGKPQEDEMRSAALIHSDGDRTQKCENRKHGHQGMKKTMFLISEYALSKNLKLLNTNRRLVT